MKPWGSFTFQSNSLDLQLNTWDASQRVLCVEWARYSRLYRDPIALCVFKLTSGSTLSLSLSLWLAVRKGGSPPRPLLIWCCRAKVRHSLGCSPDSTSPPPWGHRRSAAAGCLPESQQQKQKLSKSATLLVEPYQECKWCHCITVVNCMHDMSHASVPQYCMSSFSQIKVS